MKIEFWVIGKNSDKFIDEGVNAYLKKIKHFNDIQFHIFSDIKNIKETNILKEKEAEKYLSKIEPDDCIILLDENGDTLSSRKFAHFIEQRRNQSTKRCIFIIGGAFGFGDKLYKRSNYKISLSEMTFSHQLIRLIFLEQLYRAYTIIHNFPYHND